MLALLHSEQPKLNGVLAVLSAVGLIKGGGLDFIYHLVSKHRHDV